MASINLLIQSKISPAVIYIRLRDGKNIDLKAKTNYNIDPGNWDASTQRPVKRLLKDIDYANLDTNLSALKNNLLKEYNKSKGLKNIDTTWLKDFINPPQKEEKYPNRLVDYIDAYIEFKREDVTKATIAKCNVIKELLKRYEQHRKSDLLINEINNDFKLKFERYCINEGYAKNTTAKNIKYIKTFCKHAKGQSIETHPQLDTIKIKYYKTSHIYLTEAEIKRIEKLRDGDLTDGLENAKDWLLISCYCGQRVSDFMRFNKSMIRYEENKNGDLKPLLEFTQVKTDKIMTIPLHKNIIKILKKYDGDFPRKISDQRYNDHIKKVCEKAKINELTLGTKFTQQYKLEVISNLDGLKDYDVLEVTVNPYHIETLVPNPATSQVTVNYLATDATSAYLMVVHQNTGSTSNYIINPQVSSHTIDLSEFATGLYSIILVCDGVIQGSENLIKQ